jgi:hypothetical protein
MKGDLEGCLDGTQNNVLRKKLPATGQTAGEGQGIRGAALRRCARGACALDARS